MPGDWQAASCIGARGSQFSWFVGANSAEVAPGSRRGSAAKSSKGAAKAALAQAIRWRCGPSWRKRARTHQNSTLHENPSNWYYLFIAVQSLTAYLLQRSTCANSCPANIKTRIFRNLVGRKQIISNLSMLKQAGSDKLGQINFQ